MEFTASARRLADDFVYPSISPTTFQQNSLYAANIAEAVGFFLIITGLCLFSWLCLSCRRTLMGLLLNDKRTVSMRYVEAFGLFLELLGIALLVYSSILFGYLVWIILSILFVPLWFAALYFWYIQRIDDDQEITSHEASPLI